LRIADCRLPIADCRMNAGHSWSQIGNWKLEIGNLLLAGYHRVFFDAASSLHYYTGLGLGRGVQATRGDAEDSGKARWTPNRGPRAGTGTRPYGIMSPDGPVLSRRGVGLWPLGSPRPFFLRAAKRRSPPYGGWGRAGRRGGRGSVRLGVPTRESGHAAGCRVYAGAVETASSRLVTRQDAASTRERRDEPIVTRCRFSWPRWAPISTTPRGGARWSRWSRWEE